MPMSDPVFSSRDEQEFAATDENKGFLPKAVSKLCSLLSDWNMIINEKIAVIDWDSKATKWAKPLGHFLTFLFYLVRLLQDNLIKPNNYKFTSKEDAFDLSKSQKLAEYDYLSRYASPSDPRQRAAEAFYLKLLSGLSKILDSSLILLLLINLFLTYKFFWGCFKTYSLFNVKERPSSNNVTKHSLSGLNDSYYENIYNGSLWLFLKLLFTNKANKEAEGEEFYYTITKWAPSKFITNLFVCFCPTCLSFLLLVDISFKAAFATIIHQVILSHIVIDRFQNRINDDSIINMAVMAEFERKSLKPLTSKRFQDVQIDATPHGRNFVQFYPAVSAPKSHTFKLHSLSGDTVTQTYNPQTQEFEVMEHGPSPHNILVRPPQLRSLGWCGDCGPRSSTRDDRATCFHHRDNSSISGRRAVSPDFHACSSMKPENFSPTCSGYRSPTCMSPGQASCHLNDHRVGDHLRKKSRSPSKQSVLPSRSPDRRCNISFKGISSRSSSGSPNK